MEVLYVLKQEKAPGYVVAELVNKVKPYKRAYYENLGRGYVYVLKGNITGDQILEIINNGKISLVRLRVEADPSVVNINEVISRLEQLSKPLRKRVLVPEEEDVEEFEFENVASFTITWKEVKYSAIYEALKEYNVTAALDMDVGYNDRIYALRELEFPVQPEDEYILVRRYPPFGIIKSDGNKKVAVKRRELEIEIQKDPLARVMLNLAGKWVPAIIAGTEFGTGKLLISHGGKNGYMLLIDAKKGEITVIRGDFKVVKKDELPLVSLDMVSFLPGE